ncbi:hypothetical protein HA402_003294 [Bradysia odoriphaga]|nr:hypothetical protein HA402_003294 [Bradysia odoriphaga]
MKITTGLQCHISVVMCKLFLCVCLLHCVLVINAKSLDHPDHHHSHHTTKDTEYGGGSDANSCESVTHYFNALNVTVRPDINSKTGTLCGGHCCGNDSEEELTIKSTNNFYRMLRHHTRSLRNILESTAKTFRDHVVELTIQSENKTLNLFSQVYRRMSPLSRQPILEFYREIRNFFISRTESNLDEVVAHFFRELFPVAYHHAVHSGSDSAKGDFHVDYKNCLMHTFEDLQPFGSIPKVVAGNLIQSIGAATVFMTALDRGADILESAEEINSDYLTTKCRNHLTKMHYCAGCNGISKHKTKTCYGYCTNVMRGCLAQYVGVLDNPWSNVAESIELLYHNSVKTDKGIEEVIKTLDVKLSEAIMHAMENGPELEKKVKKSCGIPSLLPSEKIIAEEDLEVITTVQNKWVSPPNTEMLKFLVNIDKSKDFYAKIVDSVCEDEELKQDDRHCWTGDRIGDYTQTVMANGVDAQRYNPEVPLEQNAYAKTNKLNELVDKLIKLRHTVTNAMTPSQQIFDFQSDMARHDEEGSGGYRDEEDDYEDHNIGGSGDGSGYGNVEPSIPRVNTIDGETTTGSSSASTQYRISIYLVTVLIAAISTLVFAR